VSHLHWHGGYGLWNRAFDQFNHGIRKLNADHEAALGKLQARKAPPGSEEDKACVMTFWRLARGMAAGINEMCDEAGIPADARLGARQEATP
jgi:hypothetical protein